jgi:hypothetical protein
MLAILAVCPCRGGSQTPYEKKLAEFQKELAADPANVQLLMQAADFCHDEGGNDNTEAVKWAEKYYREVLRLEPGNALALARLGSTYTMKARDAFWPFTRLSLVKEGNRMMDQAVELAPKDVQVRLTRVENNRHMPGWLGREKIVQEDFAWLWEQVGTRPAAFSLEDRQSIALHHGRLLAKSKRIDAARDVWRTGEAFDPGTPEAEQIRKELKANR